MSDDHERIWLQNAIDAGHQEEGRLWCPDKVWPDDPEDGEPTEYVRADLHAAAQAEIERLREQLKKAEANEKEIAGQWERMLASYHSADSRAETARSDALEEAAGVAERWQVKWVADDIRALKEKA